MHQHHVQMRYSLIPLHIFTITIIIIINLLLLSLLLVLLLLIILDLIYSYFKGLLYSPNNSTNTNTYEVHVRFENRTMLKINW